MNITVIGAARSGLAAALLAKKFGENVFLTESKKIEDYKENAEKLTSAGIDAEFGGNSQRALQNCDLIIASPGVPPKAQIIIEAEKKGIPIISELEYASRHLKNPIIAITGTNGKTTTTTLTAYILNQAGKKAISCGNIGTPMSSLVGNIDSDTILVAELSSFQLDRIDTFRPDVAAVLNISPDHLYYHGSMEKYIEAKLKISCNQNENNLLILNKDDSILSRMNVATKAKIAWFSTSPVDWGIYGNNSKMYAKLHNQHKEEEIMLFEEIGIPGVHNAYNSMAAALAARAFEISNENIRDSLMTFKGVEHRLEHVRTFEGVDYINDSKATNVNATWFALQSYDRPLIWIAGGRGDSNDYSLLDDLVKKNVKTIVAIGEEAEAIFNHFCTQVRCYREDSMDGAVNKAREEAEFGDIVLFTPACKSFDMFMNFEHRGEVFKETVNQL